MFAEICGSPNSRQLRTKKRKNYPDNIHLIPEKGIKIMNNRLVQFLANRLNFIKDGSSFNFWERVKVVCNLGDGELRRLISSKLKIDEDGKSYLHIGRYNVYFDVDYDIHDYEYFFKGVQQVIIESFIYLNYFNSKVHPSKGDVVFDVGANIGTISMVLSDIVGNEGHVFSFEPVTYSTLTKNIESNKIANVSVIPKGLSDKNDRTEINISDFTQDSRIEKGDQTT